MTTPLSILEAHDERVRLEQAAEETWRTLAKKLEALIPEDLRLMAEAFNWIEGDEPWRLPLWLKKLVEKNQEGFNEYVCIQPCHLADYGFTDFEDAKRKMNQLPGAWKNLVRMECADSGNPGNSMFFHFTAVEFEPKALDD